MTVRNIDKLVENGVFTGNATDILNSFILNGK